MLQVLADAVQAALDLVRRRPLLAFLAGAFAISWSDWLSIGLDGGRVLPGRLPSDMVGMAGPALSALVVTAIAGGDAGLRGLALRVVRVPWRSPATWLLAPAPLWILLAVLAARAVAGEPVPAMAAFGRYPGLPTLPPLAVFDLVLVGVGFGQEIGWRGLALPVLQGRLGPVRGAILLALPWGAWMAPSLLLTGPPAWATPFRVAVALLLVVSSSVVLAFVVARTGGSLLPAAVWHASLRVALVTEGAGGGVGARVGAAVVAWAVVLLVAESISRRRSGSILVPPGGTAPFPPA